MSYVDEVLAKLKQKNAAEPEFLQAAEEVLNSLRRSSTETRSCTAGKPFWKELPSRTASLNSR